MNNEKKKLISAGMGYTIGNYLIKGLSFLTIPIFARLLESYDYGIYNTYIAYENIIYIIIGLALHSSFKNAKYKYLENFNRYVSACVLLGIISAILWFLIFNILYRYISSFLELERWLMNLLIIHSLGSALIQYYNTYVSLYYEYGKFLKISFINAGINISVSVFLILFIFSSNKYYGRIIGVAVPVIIIGIYVVIYFIKKGRPLLNGQILKFALSYSLPIIPHGISQVILAQFDRIMISNMIGVTEAGIYSFAYNIYTIIQVTGNSLSNIWEPWFFERMYSKSYNDIKKNGFLFGAGMLVFSALLCLLAPEIILIIGTNKYSESIYCVIPIIIGGYFSFIYILPCEIEYYYEKTKYIAIATSVAAVINVMLNYTCIKNFSYIAAAYTTLITYLIYFCFHYFISVKIAGRYIYDNKQIFLLVVSALAICVLSILIIDFILVRWLLAGIIILICILFLENKYKFMKKYLKNNIF